MTEAEAMKPARTAWPGVAWMIATFLGGVSFTTAYFLP